MWTQLDKQLLAIAEVQHLVFHRRQAVAVGFSERQIEWRLMTGIWIPVFHEVYRLATGRQTSLQRTMAATLAGGDGTVVSEDSASVLWGFPHVKVPRDIHVTIPRGHDHTVPGVVAHEARNLHPADITRRHGIPITTADRTAFDMAKRLSPLELLDVIDHITLQGYTTAARMKARSRALSGRGVAGCRRFREVVDVWIEEGKVSMTKFERMLFREFDAASLPRPKPQHVVKAGGRVFKFDYAYPEIRFGIEAHSRKHHGEDLVKAGDLDRHMLLTVTGYRVAYVRYRDLIYRPTWVTENIAAAIAAATAA